jgi:2-succinyl-5-enolpyruvyl-6-hydroxy-3-cyclohexene-1-carboxylate synthase
MEIANSNYLHAAVLLDTLRRLGVRRVVISPGARSTPLARTAFLMEDVQCEVMLDERGAAFFALGQAKASRAPTALICTSGTAGANYFPAIIEAKQSFVPLIVLTADRPLRLRNSGAMQTIDQQELFGKYTNFFVNLPEAGTTIERAKLIREIVREAYAAAVKQPPGPVHINVPLDEPLAPIEDQAGLCAKIYAQLESEHFVMPAIESVAALHADEFSKLLPAISNALCGLIVCGPGAAQTSDEAEAIHQLARQLGWPVLADVVSGLRLFPDPVFPYYDLFLRNESLAGLAPDCVIEIGGCPTSKILNEYLNRHREAFTIRVQPNSFKQDPFERADKTNVCDCAIWCRTISASTDVSRDSLLYEPFQRASGRLRSIIPTHFSKSEKEGCELHFAQAALDALPDDANLVLASSLSLRYGDLLVAADGRKLQPYAQRGTNGIDGAIAHAAGIAAASEQPTLLMIGDLAFCHDLGSLTVARKFPNLTILLFNNNGGGIFHMLPISKYEDTFETLHGTPQYLNLQAAAKLFDLDWHAADFPGDVRATLNSKASGKMRVIEVRVDRKLNHARYVALIEHLSHRLS